MALHRVADMSRCRLRWSLVCMKDSSPLPVFRSTQDSLTPESNKNRCTWTARVEHPNATTRDETTCETHLSKGEIEVKKRGRAVRVLLFRSFVAGVVFEEA